MKGITLYKTMIHNDPKLTEIVEKITIHLQPTKMYLFGSHARGEADSESDYDLLVIYDGEKSKREAELEVYRLFDHFDFSMDIFFLTSEEFEWMKPIANTLAREVSENGVVIYG